MRIQYNLRLYVAVAMMGRTLNPYKRLPYE